MNEKVTISVTRERFPVDEHPEKERHNGGDELQETDTFDLYSDCTVLCRESAGS